MDAQQKQLKGLRFIFLKNDEDLSDDAKSIHAKIAFHRWIKLAEETQIPELRTWRVPFGINSMELSVSGRFDISLMQVWKDLTTKSDG